MRALLQKLEPVIWGLFGGGMFVGALVLPAWLLAVGVLAPLGLGRAADYDHIYALFTENWLARPLLFAAIALPFWAGAHHLRHLQIDFGGLARDGWFGALCYLAAVFAGIFAAVAVINL